MFIESLRDSIKHTLTLTLFVFQMFKSVAYEHILLISISNNICTPGQYHIERDFCR